MISLNNEEKLDFSPSKTIFPSSNHFESGILNILSWGVAIDLLWFMYVDLPAALCSTQELSIIFRLVFILPCAYILYDTLLHLSSMWTTFFASF